jgi:glycosyltransferase involved in cell wall biosynthesis
MQQLVIVNYALHRQPAPPQRLLDEYVHLCGWAEGVQRAGAVVDVFLQYHADSQLERKGVSYHFVKDPISTYASRLRIPGRLQWAINAFCRERLRQGDGVVIHINGLLFPLSTRHLRSLLPTQCGIVVQHHAELPMRGWRRRLQSWGLRVADGFFFTNRELAQRWLTERVIRAEQPIYEIMETSSLLTYQERAAARLVTQMQGAPVILWAGNLNPNKDPVTILKGYGQLLAYHPQARLYMLYRTAELLGTVRQTIEQQAPLRSSVTLLGTIPYAQIGVYFNSADLFVQGSAKEGSGVALLDALACGVIPVVTNIPAFRTITNEGAVGALWPVGQPAALADALRHVLQQPLAAQSHRAHALFQNQWSFDTIGKSALRAYMQIQQRR